MKGTARSVDRNGFLEVKGCPISSFGIFDYSAAQVGLDGDPNRIVKVYRPESAITDPAAIESFKNVPFIDDHEMLSGFDGDESTSAPEDYGVDGVLTSNVYYEKPWMRGDLKVFSRKLRNAIDSGKCDLSLGYDCDFIVQSGEFNGVPYEVIQTNLRGNHIALVDIGRVAGARVLDGRCFDHLCLSVNRPSDEDKSMIRKAMDKATKDNAVEQLKALIPALEQFLNEEAAEPAHQEGATASEQPLDASPEATAAEPSAPEGGADPAAAATASAEPAAEPSAEPSAPEGGDELAQLVARVKQICAQLEGAPTGDDKLPGAAEGTVEQSTEDAVNGLQQNEGTQGAQADIDNDGKTEAPKASPGPSAGTNTMAKDQAVRDFYADSARKDSIYKRLSKVVGTFDCATMDAASVAKYGIKKLGIKCADGFEFDALDAYLAGREQGIKSAPAPIQTKVGDSATVDAPEIDAYLKG